MTHDRRVICKSCGDSFENEPCPKCVARHRKVLRKGKDPVMAHCPICHAEIFHGMVPRVTDGRMGAVPTTIPHENDAGEDSPWHENAVREMEDPR